MFLHSIRFKSRLIFSSRENIKVIENKKKHTKVGKPCEKYRIM